MPGCCPGLALGHSTKQMTRNGENRSVLQLNRKTKPTWLMERGEGVRECSKDESSHCKKKPMDTVGCHGDVVLLPSSAPVENLRPSANMEDDSNSLLLQ
ncbi:urocanate hydratase [Anopheles sinensis]|uniref:Urocanate hydratase n=1 Tax=Anopheles sinensis TaxID=74873 RepID=A0A084VGW6_ANOSI|nr:urocanate hydratase [Anopheles sinensis]